MRKPKILFGSAFEVECSSTIHRHNVKHALHFGFGFGIPTGRNVRDGVFILSRRVSRYDFDLHATISIHIPTITPTDFNDGFRDGVFILSSRVSRYDFDLHTTISIHILTITPTDFLVSYHGVEGNWQHCHDARNGKQNTQRSIHIL